MMNWPNLLWWHDGELLRWDDGERLRLGDNNGHRVVGWEKLVSVDLTVADHWGLGKESFGYCWKVWKVGMALGQAGGLVLYPESTCRRGQIWDHNRDKSICMKKYGIKTRILQKGCERQCDMAYLPDRLASLACGANRPHLSTIHD
jgi:hypothetical protein